MNSKLMLLACSMLVPGILLSAPDRKKKQKKADKEIVAVKKTSDYEKLFQGKKHEMKKGLITLHKVDDTKVYFEFPLSLMGRDMLLGSAVSEISNNEHSVLGYKSKYPMHINFELMGDKVNLCMVNSLYTAAEGENEIARAVKKSTIGSIFKSFKIEAYNMDSTAVVFEATPLFMTHIEDIDPFDPYSRMSTKPFNRSVSFQKDMSHLGDIKSFEDNFSVKSYLTYKVDVAGQIGNMRMMVENKNAFTALVTRSFLLLPEKPMRPRLADPRMNIFVSGKARFSGNENRGTLPEYYARRWNVEPSDMEKWKRGELVEPKKQIVFYVDSDFPESWKAPIHEAVEQWNEAFEKIGLKNVMKAVDFPENDPEFDPDNLKYSCLRYQPISIMNAMGPSWVDPRSGEIVNASVLVYHDIIKLITRWRFTQTAPADPRVRTTRLPDDIMHESLRYVIAHEVGHCLSFMHNMASSAAIPVDSLRSPSFTQKYGTTYSIMDYARFNHVAQPGDAERGVSMTPPRLGLHDYFAVKWLYSPVPEAKTMEEEKKVLESWVAENADDPIYRYGNQQVYNIWDPSSQSEDLGDDLVKASEYGVKNLKYLMENMNDWVADEDPDMSFREMIYKQILQQYFQYVYHVYNVKGGVYLNERYAGDPRPAYRFVEADYQRRAQKFLCEQLNDLEWLNNPKLLRELPLMGNMAVKMQRMIMSLVMADRGAFTKLKSPEKNAYTIEEHQQDAFDAVFASTRAGKDLTDAERSNQIAYLDMMFLISGLEKQEKNAQGITSLSGGENDLPMTNGAEYDWQKRIREQDIVCSHISAESMSFEHFWETINQEDYMGFGFFRGVAESLTPKFHLYYAKIKEARELVGRMKNTGSKATQAHYQLLLHRIDGLLR